MGNCVGAPLHTPGRLFFPRTRTPHHFNNVNTIEKTKKAKHTQTQHTHPL